MSDLFNDKKINLKEWSIDKLYNEWTSTSSDLQRCIHDRKFASKNKDYINEYKDRLEYELDLKGFDWNIS